MPITSSGQIALIADIEAEFDQTGTTDISLFTARDDAGLTAGEVAMTDFYGLSDAAVPTVVTNAASSVATTSMTLNGNVTADGGATVTSRGFYFGTSSTYSSNTKYTSGSGTGAFTLNRTGLSQNTTYYITAFAVNSAGESVGSTVSQKTLFNYTFESQRIGRENNSAYSTLQYHYYSNVNGGWLLSFSLNASTGNGCGNFCTNRQNYNYVTLGSRGQYDQEIFYSYNNQCGNSGTISNHSGTSGTSQSSSFTNSTRVAYFNTGQAGGFTYTYV